MVDDATTDELARWRLDAVQGLVAAVEAAPDAPVPAYPDWLVRDLALHVVRTSETAVTALRTGALERPRPEVPVAREDDPATLADAVRHSSREAEAALEDCGHEVVWTPVGARGSWFWQRRLLREAVLHRWDAEQAGGAPQAPGPETAGELIDEFFDTDIVRAFVNSERERSGVVAVQAGARQWTIDLGGGAVAIDSAGGSDAATISGEPAVVWLWLMRREQLPGSVSIDDVGGAASAFTDLIDQMNRPSR